MAKNEWPPDPNTMVGTVRDKVATLKKQGKPVGEVIALKPSAAFDRKWGGGIGPDAFVDLSTPASEGFWHKS